MKTKECLPLTVHVKLLLPLLKCAQANTVVQKDSILTSFVQLYLLLDSSVIATCCIKCLPSVSSE